MRDASAGATGRRRRVQHARAASIVVGAGVAGLARRARCCAPASTTCRVLDLEDGRRRQQPRPRDRRHAPARSARTTCRCRASAAIEVIELLDELGVRRIEHGRPVYDERSLCHSPQERLFIDGALARRAAAADRGAAGRRARARRSPQYRRVRRRRRARGPAATRSRSRPRARAGAPTLAALDAMTFAALARRARACVAPALRWYLDYCCRDDYGAGAAQVSAWAGLHYFASRHGFHAPGRRAPTSATAC